jgi:hypothetical protein
MKQKLKTFFSNKFNLALVIVLVLILGGAGFAVNKFFTVDPSKLPTEEIDLSFEPEGPYAILEPRRDGNAVNLNIFRTSSYDSINYELAYQSAGSTADEGIGMVDRGVQGTIEAKDKKSEYRQEILFGTCSKGDTFSTLHCVFDKNVENGSLILRIKKPYEKGDKTNVVYKMNTTWHLQKPDVTLGVVTSTDSHFTYRTSTPSVVTAAKPAVKTKNAKAEPVADNELSIVGFVMVNDLTGAPKLPNGKKALGKVYAMTLPTAKVYPAGELTIELIENAPNGAQIARYNESANSWDLLETKIEGGKLTAQAPGAGIFAVFINAN